MSFLVRQQTFEGPIDLLLTLIEDKKMHINTVSLATVTDEYRQYMEAHEVSSDELSQFLVVLATLILVKAKSLLPSLQVTEEENQSIADLTDRLELLKKFREYAKLLESRWEKSPLRYSRAPRKEMTVFAPDARTTPASLLEAIQSILARTKEEIELVEREKLSEAKVAPVIHIKDVISRIETAISEGATFSMTDVMGRYQTAATQEEKKVVKVEAIVTFLALLELARNGIALLTQADNGSIVAEKYQSNEAVVE